MIKTYWAICLKIAKTHLYANRKEWAGSKLAFTDKRKLAKIALKRVWIDRLTFYNLNLVYIFDSKKRQEWKLKKCNY